MSNVGLTLGPVSFRDFEIPSGLSFGGKQILAIHQLADGRRVIDAVGPADSNIAFGGVFSGSAAAERARLLNSLRSSGVELSLVWETFCYSVIISQFSADFRSMGWIPYWISCTVVRDEAAPPAASPLSLALSVVSDMSSASQVCSDLSIDFPYIPAVLTELDATQIGASEYSAAQAALLNLQTEVQVRQAVAQRVLQGTELTLNSSAILMPAGIAELVTAARETAGLSNAYGYVARAAKFMASASA